MFMTEQLNLISQLIIGKPMSEKPLGLLEHKYVNLEATLLRAKILRNFAQKSGLYIAQSEIEEQQPNLGFLFSPFILANLNKPVIYSTPMAQPVLNILNKYYAADKAPNFKINETLDSFSIYIDLESSHLAAEDFIYLSVFRALCRPDILQIFIITDLAVCSAVKQKLENFFNVKISLISRLKNEAILESSALNIRKLLFKNKDDYYVRLCSEFSDLNAEIISISEGFTMEQSKNLIEDMFYSEHIYEKLSVYGEFFQTRLKNTQHADAG